MRRSRPLTSGFVFSLVSDLVQFVSARLRSRTALVAENLFLRKQLAFYREHKVRPRPLTDAARLSLVFWSRLFDWKNALMNRQARHAHRLASQRVQAVLALEVSPWQASATLGDPRIDCTYGA
jgi:hypothetical protein